MPDPLLGDHLFKEPDKNLVVRGHSRDSHSIPAERKTDDDDTETNPCVVVMSSYVVILRR